MAKNTAKSAPTNGQTIQLVLPAPRQASGDPAYNLTGVLKRSFSKIELTNGKKRVTVIGRGAKNPGTLILDYIGAVMVGSLSGRSNTTDGVTLWVAENCDNEVLARINKYDVHAEATGRGGIYEAPFSQFVEVCKARAAIFGPSIDKFPRQKDKRDTQRGDGDEGMAVEVVL